MAPADWVMTRTSAVKAPAVPRCRNGLPPWTQETAPSALWIETLEPAQRSHAFWTNSWNYVGAASLGAIVTAYARRGEPSLERRRFLA